MPRGSEEPEHSARQNPLARSKSLYRLQGRLSLQSVPDHAETKANLGLPATHNFGLSPIPESLTKILSIANVISAVHSTLR